MSINPSFTPQNETPQQLTTSGSSSTPGKPKRKYFTDDDDRVLVKTLMANRPSSVSHGNKEKYWEDMAKKLSVESGRVVQSRLKKLLKKNAARRNNDDRKSGQEQELVPIEQEFQESLDTLENEEDDNQNLKKDKKREEKQRKKVPRESRSHDNNKEQGCCRYPTENEN